MSRNTYLNLSFVLAVSITLTEAKTTQADLAPAYAIIGAIALALIYYCVTKLCQDIFPDGARLFDSVDLDDIRIDRLNDIENNIKNNIKDLTKKLAFHRVKKKTEVLADRDLRIKLIERSAEADDRGRTIYGEAWDYGDGKDGPPLKDLLKLTTKEAKSIRKEAEEILVKRKEEEKRDLWEIWNEMKNATSEPVYGDNDIEEKADFPEEKSDQMLYRPVSSRQQVDLQPLVSPDQYRFKADPGTSPPALDFSGLSTGKTQKSVRYSEPVKLSPHSSSSPSIKSIPSAPSHIKPPSSPAPNRSPVKPLTVSAPVAPSHIKPPPGPAPDSNKQKTYKIDVPDPSPQAANPLLQSVLEKNSRTIPGMDPSIRSAVINKKQTPSQKMLFSSNFQNTVVANKSSIVDISLKKESERVGVAVNRRPPPPKGPPPGFINKTDNNNTLKTD